MSRRAWIWQVARYAAVLFVTLALIGCSATRGRRGAPELSGFLGDYSKLEKKPDYAAALIFIDPSVDWSRYDAVQIDSVTLWSDEETSALSDEEQQMVTELLYQALHEQLSQSFAIADGPGSSVLGLRAALTKASGAMVPLRTVTSFLPPALVLSTAVGLSADAVATVGEASVEMEVVDSITNRRLAAAVDSRAGTKHPFTTRTFKKWGDVEAAADEWAVRVREFLVRQGVRQKG